MIASLTRSNESGDIGFMAEPERLNVLITRARNGIVLVGNMGTFMRSKKGAATWHPFFDLLKTRGHLYDGLPVQCGKHPEKTALLKEPLDFDKSCPDGGCTELWCVSVSFLRLFTSLPTLPHPAIDATTDISAAMRP